MGAIVLKSAREIGLMRQAGRIAACALREAGRTVEPGVSTAELDRIARRCIERMGAVPSFLNYNGFPASACIPATGMSRPIWISWPVSKRWAIWT